MKTAQQLVGEVKPTINEVSIEQLQQALSDHHTILIDVREQNEFANGHIDRAVNYPRGVLEFRIHQHPSVTQLCDTEQALQELANKPVYLICQSGGRSALSAEALTRMGFNQVKSVAGGMQAWTTAGLPVTQ